MTRANYCEFFRFNNRYCDVFVEDDHYLYAEATPCEWPYMLQCNEWHAVQNLHGETEWIRYDTGSADTEYLETLEYAPVEIAREIIRREYARTLYYSTRGGSCYWHGFDEPPTMEECIEEADGYAADLVNFNGDAGLFNRLLDYCGDAYIIELDDPDYNEYRECLFDGCQIAGEVLPTCRLFVVNI